MIELNEIEVRILGCLFEKERSTPDYYPMTLNSLKNACNQKSSRNPVLNLSEEVITKHLLILKEKSLVYKVDAFGSRVMKYRHNMYELWNLTVSQLSILAVLMLRGDQTLGEIKTRTDRMNHFDSINEVQEIIDTLMNDENKFIYIVPKKSGQKENRFMHLFYGENLEIEENQDEVTIKVLNDNQRIHDLETECQNLKDEVLEIKKQLEQIKNELGL